MKSLSFNVSKSVPAGTGSSVPPGRGLQAASRRRLVSRRAGFTLVELMVVVAIVAILAAIALPSYTKYVQKSRRASAKACLSEYANYMERYYTTNLEYDKAGAGGAANTLPTSDCASAGQTGDYYDYTIPTLTASAYTLTATPKGAQAADSCGALGLDQTGNRTASDSTCW